MFTPQINSSYLNTRADKKVINKLYLIKTTGFLTCFRTVSQLKIALFHRWYKPHLWNANFKQNVVRNVSFDLYDLLIGRTNFNYFLASRRIHWVWSGCKIDNLINRQIQWFVLYWCWRSCLGVVGSFLPVMLQHRKQHWHLVLPSSWFIRANNMLVLKSRRS